MGTKFTVQIEFVLEDELVTKAIEIARQAYTSGGGASTLVHGEEQAIPAEQFITCSEQALMELIEGNPLFEQAGIVVDAVSCRREDAPPIEPVEPEIALEDELDEEDSGVYVCRWPNGDSSIVMAGSKREAMIALDEWDAADPSWLTPMDACLVDFRLNSRVGLSLLSSAGKLPTSYGRSAIPYWTKYGAAIWATDRGRRRTRSNEP